MRNLIDLTGKRIIVTGASSGMGQEAARLISRIGGVAGLIARRTEKLQETLEGMDGDGHRIYPYDLLELEGIESLVQRIIDDLGPIDGLVHSAGIPGTRPLKLMKPDALQNVMTVNFYSFVELVRCITKENFYRPGLSIVGVSSVSSKLGSKGKVSYAASKAALDSVARTLADELRDKQIRVNTICPGLIQTDIFTTFQNNAGDSEDAKGKLDRQYLGIGRTEDIANMICFLLSDASKMISGKNIDVDGGMLSS